MGANYTPNLQTYSGQGAFRFWCQKVLPLVYDDSLSYYELLNKVVIYLNNTISDVATMGENIDDLLTAYNELQDYVNTYFDNLDVQTEINNKLDAMAADGYFNTILDPTIADATANWLYQNVNPVGSAVVVDSTLAISGAAADAKVTGDNITDLKRTVSRYADLGLTAYTPVRGTVKTGFIATDGTENTTNTNYCHFDFDIPKGTKKIYYQPWRTYGTGSSYSSLAYYDSDGNFISSVTNADLNNTGSTVIVQSYEGDVPGNATKATITFIADQNQLGNVVFYGYYDIKKHTRTLNNHLSADSNTPLYLQVVGCLPYSELSDAKLSLTARIKCSKTPQAYDVYVVGYDSSYNNRIICGYFSNMTRGMSGNTIDINFNAYNKNNTLSSKHYVGFLVNIKYEYDNTRPDYVQSFYRFTNEIVHDIEYFYINDIDVSANVFHIGGEASNVNVPKNEVNNPLYGGRLCCIGDSLTGVYYKTEEESWPYLIAKWNNMKLDNLGISGNPMAKTDSYTENDCMAERVDDLDANKYYTHIFVMGGANDYNYSIPIGTNTDSVITTFKGAINHIIDTLIQKFPFAHIVFATTYQRNANKLDEPYADAMLEVCEYRCIPCLDNYRKSGVLMFNERWMRYHGATHALGNNHLSAAGDAFVAPRFEKALKYGVE